MLKTEFTLEKLIITISNNTQVVLWFDGNGKITKNNGTFENPVANSFSLVQKDDCPFATKICKSVCYVNNLEKAEIEIHNKFKHNSKRIREILNNPVTQEIVEEAFAQYIQLYCSNGFRWHVSGDVFSREYARFIASICKKIPNVFCWIYTRSFDYLGLLHGIQNLVINLSADEENINEAREAHMKFGFRICYLTINGKIPDWLPTGSVIFPSYNLRGKDLDDPATSSWWQSLSEIQKKMVCPADFFGQNEKNRCGPCKKCLIVKQNPIF